MKSQVTVCQREGIYSYLQIPEVEAKTTAPRGFLDNKSSENTEYIWVTHLKAAQLREG